MDATSQVTVIAAIAGATALVKAVLPAQIQGWATICVVLVIGLVAGFAGLEGLTPLTGVLSAFAAAGTMSAIDRINRDT